MLTSLLFWSMQNWIKEMMLKILKTIKESYKRMSGHASKAAVANHHKTIAPFEIHSAKRS